MISVYSGARDSKTSRPSSNSSLAAGQRAQRARIWMSEQQDRYSTDGIEWTQYEQRVCCTKSKDRLVFTDDHERL